MDAEPVQKYTFDQLMSSKSLIQAYLCTALAKCFFNFDVLWTIDLEKRWRDGLLDDDPDDLDEDKIPPDNALGLKAIGYVPRRFKMRDDTMHQSYLPLTCALKLCDDVRPERVAYVLASYLSDQVPLYTAGRLSFPLCGTRS